MHKKIARLRRAKSTRSHIRNLGVPRLSVLRTGQHLYAQLFSADGAKVLASASTVQADVKEGLKSGKNTEAAAKVGQVIAERAKAAGYREGRVRPLGLPLPRPHQGAGRCGPRRRPAVLMDSRAWGFDPHAPWACRFEACLPMQGASGASAGSGHGGTPAPLPQP